MDRSQYYTVSHPEEFTINWAGFYDQVEIMTHKVRNKLDSLLDIPYSLNNDPKQTLDIYSPKDVKSAPVFIFLHGGGFIEGDKDYYGYVALPFSMKNIITVVPNYRLAPENKYPTQIGDVRDVIAWVYHNIGRMGGNRNQIYLSGHSAGAILSASTALDPNWVTLRDFPIDIVKGCFPISAWYDLRKIKAKQIIDAYVPSSLIEEASPILNITRPPKKNLVAVGTKGDPESLLVEPSQNLVEKLSAKGAQAELLVLEGMNHADTVLSLADSDSKLTQGILKIIGA